MMLKLVTYFNRMLKKSTIEIGDVEIKQTSTVPVNLSTARSLEQMSEEAQLSQVVADKIYSFVSTRSLKWKVRSKRRFSALTPTRLLLAD